jgi:hypothetical protein
MGEGTSIIVREFAWVSSRKLNRTVLLLDADRNNPSQHLAFNIKPRYGWEDLLKGKEEPKQMDEVIYRIGDSSLFLSPASAHPSSGPQVLDSFKVREFLEELRPRFDLILVDSPPAIVSPESMAFCRLSDGVVLVLGAEETRWQVAEKVKDQTISNGGNILGLVLNKRRHYLPDFMKSPPWIPRAGARGGKGDLALRMEYNRPHEPQTDEPCGVRYAIPLGVGAEVSQVDLERRDPKCSKGVVQGDLGSERLRGGGNGDRLGSCPHLHQHPSEIFDWGDGEGSQGGQRKGNLPQVPPG